MDDIPDYYIAATALAVGVIVVGVTSWIEHRRQSNPMPHLVPTTPFMLFGTIVVLLAIGFSVTLFGKAPTTNRDTRASERKTKLTGDEIAELKARLSMCWIPPPDIAGIEGLNLSVRISLNADGSLSAKPELIRAPASLSGPALLERAMWALQQCQPYSFLPASKYEEWRILDLSFSPQGPYEVLPSSGLPRQR